MKNTIFTLAVCALTITGAVAAEFVRPQLVCGKDAQFFRKAAKLPEDFNRKPTEETSVKADCDKNNLYFSHLSRKILNNTFYDICNHFGRRIKSLCFGYSSTHDTFFLLSALFFTGSFVNNFPFPRIMRKCCSFCFPAYITSLWQ